MSEDAARSLRAAALFKVSVNETTVNTELKDLMWKWEKVKSKKLRVWWDSAMLKSYVEKSVIPRGLRINKKNT